MIVLNFCHKYDYHVPNRYYVCTSIRNIINMFTTENIVFSIRNIVLASSYRTYKKALLSK